MSREEIVKMFGRVPANLFACTTADRMRDTGHGTGQYVTTVSEDGSHMTSFQIDRLLADGALTFWCR
jgi:hypothetical protein